MSAFQLTSNGYSVSEWREYTHFPTFSHKNKTSKLGSCRQKYEKRYHNFNKLVLNLNSISPLHALFVKDKKKTLGALKFSSSK